MTAVAEARSIVERTIALVPREPRDNKASLLRKAAGVLSLSYWQAKKIRYDEIRTVDADKLSTMKERLEEYCTRLSNLKATADDNQARLNALIFARHEIAGTRPAYSAGHLGAAVREPGARDGGGEGEGDRPSSAFVPRIG